MYPKNFFSNVDVSSRKAILFMLLSTLGASTVMMVVKSCSNHYSIMQIIFFRNIGALALYYLIAKTRERKNNILTTSNMPLHLIHTFFGFIAMIFYFYSFALMPLAEATTLSFTAPLFVALLSAPLLKEHVSNYSWLAITFGFLGVLITIQPGTAVFQPNSWLAMCASIFCAFALIILRKLGKKENIIVISFYYALFSTLLLIPILPFFWVSPTILDLLMLVLIGVGGGVEQLLATSAFQHAPAALISPISYTAIIWASIFGYFIWGDIPQIHTYLGAIFIIISTLFILKFQQRKIKT